MIRIATIGTSIITDNLIQVLHRNPDAAFVGTLSRNAERARAFTEEHGGTRPFTSLDELAGAPDVDAIYIASPNALHHDQALACIAGGKHVLVEKPFAANEREAREVFAAAARAGVIALEAMRSIHDPAWRACETALADLGRVRRATLRFGKYSSRYDEVLAGRRTNIFDCRMASGSLMDIGVYCVEPMVELFGAPERVNCTGVLLDEPTRALTNGAIDGAGVICASYPDLVATLDFSKITADLAATQIEGEAGTMTIDEISSPTEAIVRLRGKAVREGANSTGANNRNVRERRVALPACEAPSNMCYELADFIQAIQTVREGAPSADAPAGAFGTVGHYRQTTLASLSVMDEARRQMGVVFPADRA